MNRQLVGVVQNVRSRRDAKQQKVLGALIRLDHQAMRRLAVQERLNLAQGELPAAAAAVPQSDIARPGTRDATMCERATSDTLASA